ncbi:MAG: hypothetical protein ACE5G7_06155 [Candidatus Hydrothermarchaeaceae archaeon]
MIIEIKKSLRREDVIATLEKKYGSIDKLEEALREAEVPEMMDDYEVWGALLGGGEYTESVRLEEKGVLSLLTPKRMELLDYLKTRHPKSIMALARGLRRDYKNVYDDLRLLGEYGVVERVGDGKKVVPECRIKEIVVKLEAEG